MSADRDSGEGLRRILRLAPDCDPTSLSLTPEEGFLLSRIDGSTPWRLLREIGGMDPDEADLCVDGWIARGIVKVEGLAEEPKRETPLRKLDAPKATPGVIDEALIDPDLELEVEVQRRILLFESNLSLSYYEILGVEEDAETKDIKKAYFKLSREFHPDRYFRRNIAGYVDRLERIFKKVLECYEILSDPELRAELGQQATVEPGGDPRMARPPTPNRPLTKLERLQQRMPFKIPQRLLEERRQKAEELFRAAELSERSGQLQEALSSVRIAISFDPTNAVYRSVLVDLQARVAEQRAMQLLEECDETYATNTSELQRVLKLLEDVLLYRPHDPSLNNRAAGISVQLEDWDRAEDYARSAVEHSPEIARYHTTMGFVHRGKGETGHAKREFEKALELDYEDGEARKALASLKLGRPMAAQGG